MFAVEAKHVLRGRISDGCTFTVAPSEPLCEVFARVMREDQERFQDASVEPHEFKMMPDMTVMKETDTSVGELWDESKRTGAHFHGTNEDRMRFSMNTKPGAEQPYFYPHLLIFIMPCEAS
eukprot:TRINITY_DN18166_c0_g1_i1.p2 TRINITY_DN18166_c0_g1~~TRINITY_DN18166_c0_g1_i1.p2  ORF type:complete len:121 (-),score=31.72 TRINITY_DN18166_c0_g1_i1:232-594(-)